MQKIVISGSAKLPEKINYWVNYFSNKGYLVLDYPKTINKDEFLDLYPKIHKDFYQNIKKTDILFIMNEDKKGIEGYIGPAVFAELSYGVIEYLNNRNILLMLLKMPSKEVNCYEEINLWLKLGWIKIWEEK